MIVDSERKFIFVRHQKTASSSIVHNLNLKINSPYKTHAQLNKHVRNSTGKSYDGHHVPLYELRNVYPDVYTTRHEYFKFGFTRNPWSRLVSAWRFAYVPKRHGNISFDRFIRGDHDDWTGVGMNTLEFCDGCDFIGRVETIQQDFDTVCDKIGIPRMKVSHTNKSKHNHYTKYYGDETREIVAERYARDIEHFGYKFGE